MVDVDATFSSWTTTIGNYWGTNRSEVDGAAAATDVDVSSGITNAQFIDVLFGNLLTGAAGDGNDIVLVESSTSTSSNDGDIVISWISSMKRWLTLQGRLSQ